MIKTELEKLKTNVDSILNSMENLKAKTDSDDQILIELAFSLPSVVKDSATRPKMEVYGTNVYDAISKNCEDSVISRLSILGDNLIPYLTGVLPGILAIKNTYDNWKDSFRNQYIPRDVSHNIIIRLLTTKMENDMNIFQLPVLFAPDDFIVSVTDVRKVIEIRRENVTVSDTVTPKSEVADNTLYIAKMGLVRGIYCKSLVYSGAKMFVKCDGNNTPEAVLGKLGYFIN